MCIDYRALNAVTKKNGYPLPRIQECCDLIGQAKYLSKIDLTQGYYQVRVDTTDREKTAFNTRQGKFEFLAMPFGLANAPATFQTLMNRVFKRFIDAGWLIVYLDDIVIFSQTLMEHLEHLQQVFTTLHEAKLYTKPSKVILAVPELEFCGHLLGNGKIRPLHSKIQVICDWPVPENVHEVRQFLGLVTYYRRFIRAFAMICIPLFELLKEADAELRKKKFRRIIWTAACQIALEQLKRALTSEPVLLQPDTTRPFIIETDASEWAIGAVLLQQDAETGKLHPVAFDGRKLSPAEINYPVHEKELLAIKYALQTWRIYIDNGHTTIIYTDHESLKYLATMRKPSKRLARWIEEFGEYDVDLRYRKGREQVVPDAISRRPDLMGEGPRNLAAPVFAIRGFDEDTWAQHFVEYLEDGKDVPEHLVEGFRKQSSHFVVRDRILHRVTEGSESPYVETFRRADFLEDIHRNYGHLTYPGIMGIVTGRGWWHSLILDLRKFISYCPQCQIAQRSQPGLERESPQTLNSRNLQIFDRWAIDLIGPLPMTPGKNLWIVTAIEYLTGWPIARALPDAKAETIAQFFHDEIAMVYGPPKELLSDNGRNLVGEVMESYLRLLRTRHRYTTPYHPRTNGKVENFNGFLGATLTKLMVNRPIILWDQYLAQALFAVRVRIHATSRHAPYFLLFGRHPRLPTDTNDITPLDVSPSSWDQLLERVKTLQHARLIANKRLVERAIEAQKIPKKLVRPTPFIEDDWVLVRAESRNKFEGRWFGPYRIVKAHPLGTYAIADPEGNVVKTLINGQRMIPAKVTDESRQAMWNSSKIQGTLRKRGIALDEPSPEVAALFERENRETMTYDELASIPAKDWKEWERTRIAIPVGPTPRDLALVNEGLNEGLNSQPAATEVDHSAPPVPFINVSHISNPSVIEDPVPVPDTSGLLPLDPEGYDAEMLDLNDQTPEEQMDIDLPEPAEPQVPRHLPEPPKTRVPGWMRESQAGFGERQRDAGGYGLRQRVKRTR